ncbi:unnamed protein product [Soboliphyme baturini]|uniref:Apple domain-containing protein n=1 Tax=Soboliphyme baturini TaxID=241478 RepID=A0A183IMI5_9BILA|nr:unnamed protein product [Soboliphyme baturini]
MWVTGTMVSSVSIIVTLPLVKSNVFVPRIDFPFDVFSKSKLHCVARTQRTRDLPESSIIERETHPTVLISSYDISKEAETEQLIVVNGTTTRTPSRKLLVLVHEPVTFANEALNRSKETSREPESGDEPATTLSTSKHEVQTVARETTTNTVMVSPTYIVHTAATPSVNETASYVTRNITKLDVSETVHYDRNVEEEPGSEGYLAKSTSTASSTRYSHLTAKPLTASLHTTNFSTAPDVSSRILTKFLSTSTVAATLAQRSSSVTSVQGKALEKHTPIAETVTRQLSMISSSPHIEKTSQGQANTTEAKDLSYSLANKTTNAIRITPSNDSASDDYLLREEVEVDLHFNNASDVFEIVLEKKPSPMIVDNVTSSSVFSTTLIDEYNQTDSAKAPLLNATSVEVAFRNSETVTTRQTDMTMSQHTRPIESISPPIGKLPLCSENITYEIKQPDALSKVTYSKELQARSIHHCAELCYENRCLSAAFLEPAVADETGTCLLSFKEEFCSRNPERHTNYDGVPPVEIHCLKCGQFMVDDRPNVITKDEHVIGFKLEEYKQKRKFAGKYHYHSTLF